jgi:hypothetical protein
MNRQAKYTIDTSNATESDWMNWAAEASELGFPVGEWPSSIATSIGNKLPFTFDKFTHDGQAAIYKQQFGALVLTVFND